MPNYLHRCSKISLCMIPSTDAWHLWRGNHWERDRSNEMRKLVSNRLAAEYMHAGAGAQEKGDKDEAKAFMDRRARVVSPEPCGKCHMVVSISTIAYAGRR